MRYRVLVGVLALLLIAPPVISAPVTHTLQTWLDAIAVPSGVRFQVAPALAKDRIYTQLGHGDWPDIIRELLRGYNYAGTWNSAGRLIEVTVTGRNGDGSPPPTSPSNDDALFHYRQTPKVLPPPYRDYGPGSVYAVAVPVQRLRRMPKGTRVAVNLPDGRYQLVHDNAWRHDNGDLTWVGYLDAMGSRYRALITLGDDGLTGQITTPGGIYKLDSDASGDWLVDMDASGLQPGSLADDGLSSGTAPRAASPGRKAAATAQATTAPVNGEGVANPADATVTQDGKIAIDLLVLYTKSLAGRQLPTRINHLLALTNQALVDSQANVVIRLAGLRKTAYPDSGGNAAALDDLTLFRKKLAKLPRWRARAGADVVMLVRKFRPDIQGNSCGIAWVNGSDGSELTADQSFGVVGYGTTSRYYCSDYVLAHELGHTLGAAHDRQHANVAGKYPYSYGYGIARQFGDIMSYYDPELPYYANPNLTLCQGQPCGVPAGNPDAANVVRTFNKTAATVSGFMRSMLP